MRKGHLVIRGFTALCISVLSVSTAWNDEYVRWTADGDAISAPPTAVAGDPVNGKQLALDRRKANCLACHRMPFENESFQGNIGPPLDSIASRLSA
jgi:sulfur-oxidizing protein SoxX